MQIILSPEECRVIYDSIKLLQEAANEVRGDPNTEWKDIDYKLTDAIEAAEPIAKRFKSYVE